MSKITFIGKEFNCHLQCGQCTANSKGGQRCKNRVCFGFPTCWIHTKRDLGLRLKPSTIPGAGRGLFTTRLIQKDSWICPYNGEIITKPCGELRYPGDDVAPYAVSSRGGTEIADSACQRSIASMANALFKADGTTYAMSRHNCALSDNPDDNDRVWLASTKNIQAGSELFCWYGNEYTLEHDHETKRVRRPDNRPC